MGGIEEIADKKFDGNILNSVVIPLMAGTRLAANGKSDPNEVHRREIYITTAGTKQQFAYQKCSEIMNDMLNQKSAFCIGNSYELPVLFDRLDQDFIEEKRESPTYSIMDFMREYESIYTGSDSDAFVQDEKLAKSRTVGVSELEHCGDINVDYILSYDVSRSAGKENALSALVVIKITDIGKSEYIKEVVNVFSMEGQHDLWQAKFLKQKVDEFKARILIVDANGLGSGVVDFLILDNNDGYPPYRVVNDDKELWTKYESEEGLPILFALKSQNKNTKNSDMIDVLMKQFNRINIGLLKVPHEGIKDLEHKRKKKFSSESEELAEAEVPYMLTTSLCEELMNLKYVAKGGGDSDIQQISKSIPKDKVMALMYGIYWIVTQEKESLIKSNEEYDYIFTSG